MGLSFCNFYLEFTFFSNMYHILNHYKTFLNEMILKSALKPSWKFKITIHDSILEVHYYMSSVYLLNFINMYIFLIQVGNVNVFFCHADVLPYICDIWIKYNLFFMLIKNEPLYIIYYKWVKHSNCQYGLEIGLCLHNCHGHEVWFMFSLKLWKHLWLK
jgi:hypothetical protein